ncbi:MAG: hypothetical protein M5U34_29095 [Chloroflexi bacterium]|nr:hypothetical protein [Chloroflexota bacterium]
MADIIEENGGEIFENVQATLIAAATELDFLQGQDPAEFVSGLLTGKNGRSGSE